MWNCNLQRSSFHRTTVEIFNQVLWKSHIRQSCWYQSFHYWNENMDTKKTPTGKSLKTTNWCCWTELTTRSLSEINKKLVWSKLSSSSLNLINRWNTKKKINPFDDKSFCDLQNEGQKIFTDQFFFIFPPLWVEVILR